MATILAKLKAFEELDLQQETIAAVDSTSEELGEWTKKQMYEGKNKQGEPIGQYKNNAYAKKKHGMNALPGYGVPDLNLTGKHYRGIYVDAQPDGVIEVNSTVPYSKYLEANYGPEAYQVGGRFKIGYIQQDLTPELMSKIKFITRL